jgi:hypothetical protein
LQVVPRAKQGTGFIIHPDYVDTNSRTAMNDLTFVTLDGSPDPEARCAADDPDHNSNSGDRSVRPDYVEEHISARLVNGTEEQEDNTSSR